MLVEVHFHATSTVSFLGHHTREAALIPTSTTTCLLPRLIRQPKKKQSTVAGHLTHNQRWTALHNSLLKARKSSNEHPSPNKTFNFLPKPLTRHSSSSPNPHLSPPTSPKPTKPSRPHTPSTHPPLNTPKPPPLFLIHYFPPLTAITSNATTAKTTINHAKVARQGR